MTNYEESRADFEFLEAIAELEDAVEIDASVFELMRDPTKRKATELYQRAIALWFGEHHAFYGSAPGVGEIVDRYGL